MIKTNISKSFIIKSKGKFFCAPYIYDIYFNKCRILQINLGYNINTIFKYEFSLKNSIYILLHSILRFWGILFRKIIFKYK